jgi:CHAT domain-containing protein
MTATAALMEQFYERYGLQGDPAAALAEAQRTILRASGTKHPFYWAGFTTVGGSGPRGGAR